MITGGRAIQTDAHLPEDMWPEAMEAAEYFPNQTPTGIIELIHGYPYQSALFTTAMNKYGDQKNFSRIRPLIIKSIPETLIPEWDQSLCH